MPLILPFRLTVPGKDEIDGLRVVSTTFRVHGFLRFDGYILSIEWGGEVQVEDVGVTAIKDDTEPLPDERLDVPVTDLYRATLAGGWFRPRLEIQAKRVGALSFVPGEKLGVVKFRYARSERFAAIAMASALQEAIATEGVRLAIEDSAITPL